MIGKFLSVREGDIKKERGKMWLNSRVGMKLVVAAWLMNDMSKEHRSQL